MFVRMYICTYGCTVAGLKCHVALDNPSVTSRVVWRCDELKLDYSVQLKLLLVATNECHVCLAVCTADCGIEDLRNYCHKIQQL